MRFYGFFPILALLGGCVFSAYDGAAVVPVPVIIGESYDAYERESGAVYVCTLKPFTDRFRSEHRSLGRAKLDVQKQCEQKYDAMFCQERYISCKTYR